MKETIKFLSVLTGIFRSVITILFLLAIVFTALVDVNLLVAFVDMLGFTGISQAVIKPILFVIFGLMFIINFVITRHIFKAGYTGRYHLSNLVFALLFLAIDAFIFVSLRSINPKILYVLFAVNGLIVLNSILGLIGRARGLYAEADEVVVVSPENTDYIEFEADDDSNVEYIEVNEITKDDVQVIKESKISATGVVTEEVFTESTDKNKTTGAPDRVELHKNEKMVFESKDSSKNEESNTLTEPSTSSEATTIKRVAKKKDSKTKPIHLVDTTNKVDRRTAISEEETYQSSTEETREE